MSTSSASVAPVVAPATEADRPAHPSRARALVALCFLIALVVQMAVAVLTPRDGWAEYRASLKAMRQGSIVVGAPGPSVKTGIKATGKVDPHC